MGATPRIDAAAIWSDVKKNRRKRLNCPAHLFPHHGEHRFGQRVTCTRCGAWLSVGDASSYVEGFVAAGGSADAVWPGYGAPRADPIGET